MDGRNETEVERADRNWLELIQELRVAQTGIQVLAGFLLTLPFSSRFGEISDLHRAEYLVAFSLAVVTIGLMTAPVSLHRVLFARHEKQTLVRVGAFFAKTGLASLGLTLVAVVVLIFGVVVSDTAGFVAGGLVFVFYTLGWVVLPLVLLRRSERLVKHTDWLLTKSERANAQTRLDDRHPGETAWSEGNLVRPLIHGSTYFAELHERIEAAAAG